GIPGLSRGAEVHVAYAECRIERSAGGHSVNVVAGNALEEGPESAAENGLAVAEDVLREADARLIGPVVVVDNALGEVVLIRQAGAVDVRGNAVVRVQVRALRVNGAAGAVPDGKGAGDVVV